MYLCSNSKQVSNASSIRLNNLGGEEGAEG